MASKQLKNKNKVKNSSIDFRRQADIQVGHVQRAMELLVAPGESELVVSPAPAPSRAGVARYRQTLDFNVESNESRVSYAIHARPDVEAPLMVSKTTAFEPSGDDLFIEAVSEQNKIVSLTAAYLNTTLSSETNDLGVTFIPFNANGNNQTYSIRASIIDSNSAGPLVVTFLAVQPSPAPAIELGSLTLVPWTASSLFTPSGPYSPDWLGVSVIVNQGAATFGTTTSKLSLILQPASGREFSPPFAQNVMDVFQPLDLPKILGSSKRHRVTAMDVLVTYTGADLDNAGVIAVANVDSSIAADSLPGGDCSLYRAITRRPFDMYCGRLASSGQSEGGCHWFYMPDDVARLSMHSTQAGYQDDLPVGAIAIEGMKIGGAFKISYNIVIDFYSEDPQHTMLLQPSMALYNQGLAMVRLNIPLVSSNDSHLKKLAKATKRAGSKAADLLGPVVSKGIDYIRENPELFASSLLGVTM